jgi:hypothetical protein
VSDTRNRDDTSFGTLILRLRHPIREVAELGAMFGLPTASAWLASDVYDRGPDLPARVRGENYWSANIELDRRSFSDALSDVVRRLHECAKELSDFTQTGGVIAVYFQFNGKRNVGDVLAPELLSQLADMRVELHIEVFPQFGGSA